MCLSMWSVLAIIPVARAAEQGPKAASPDAAPNRAAWMAQGSYGVMTHYLVEPKGNTLAEKTADLNRIVDSFDLDHFIRQFQETGADWLIFSLGQTTGYLCSPNCDADRSRPTSRRRTGLGDETAPLRRSTERPWEPPVTPSSPPPTAMPSIPPSAAAAQPSPQVVATGRLSGHRPLAPIARHARLG